MAASDQVMAWLMNLLDGLLIVLMVIAGIVLVAVLVLCCCGFTTIGPAAGSFAAAWMSSIAKTTGAVAAGSLYACLQCLTMTPGACLVSSIVVGMGVLAAIAYFGSGEYLHQSLLHIKLWLHELGDEISSWITRIMHRFLLQ